MDTRSRSELRSSYTKVGRFQRLHLSRRRTHQSQGFRYSRESYTKGGGRGQEGSHGGQRLCQSPEVIPRLLSK